MRGRKDGEEPPQRGAGFSLFRKRQAGNSRSQATPLPKVHSSFSLEGWVLQEDTWQKGRNFHVFSFYRAHSTGAKGFHKRATQQGKQYKEGTLFCGNGQNRTLCLPQHSRIYTQVSLCGQTWSAGRAEAASSSPDTTMRHTGLLHTVTTLEWNHGVPEMAGAISFPSRPRISQEQVGIDLVLTSSLAIELLEQIESDWRKPSR